MMTATANPYLKPETLPRGVVYLRGMNMGTGRGAKMNLFINRWFFKIALASMFDYVIAPVCDAKEAYLKIPGGRHSRAAFLFEDCKLQN